jgi:hypothetical protein
MDCCNHCHSSDPIAETRHIVVCYGLYWRLTPRCFWSRSARALQPVLLLFKQMRSIFLVMQQTTRLAFW